MNKFIIIGWHSGLWGDGGRTRGRRSSCSVDKVSLRHEGIKTIVGVG